MPPDPTRSDAPAGERELVDLIARLEWMKAWDSRMDAEVAVAAGWGEQDSDGGWHAIGVFFPDGKLRRTAYTVDLPDFTWNVNAALTLVPRNLRMGIQTVPGERCSVFLKDRSIMDPAMKEWHGYAITLPAAICIASLRARAAAP